jgi:hypothetical protein
METTEAGNCLAVNIAKLPERLRKPNKRQGVMACRP